MIAQTESYDRFEQNHLINLFLVKKWCCSYWKTDQINKMILNILNILKTFTESLETRKEDF